ncbi:MAG: hypothetical protein IT374_05100 [Polyangiaceae bacterium]|nr:hypothetical protein [Polyangiaceae bacterium]
MSSIDATVVQVVGRAKLIALKRASGRPQDLVDAALLLAGGIDPFTP